MANTATRLITLILLLQQKPNQKAADLATELGVSVRTLHRYMCMLDEMGIPIYSERGPLGGFSLVRGYKMPPLVLTPEEAVAVYLGLSQVKELWGTLYRDAAEAALAKLENVLPDEQRGQVAWARRTLLATNMHRSNVALLAPLLQDLQRATHEHRRVAIKYRERNHLAPLAREVDPYALVHRWGRWYVIGHCHLRGALRTFRADRIDECRVLEHKYELPADFDVREYLTASWFPQPTLSVRIRFHASIAPWVREEPTLWESVEEESDGSLVVSLLTTDLEYAVGMASSFGPLAEVLEPEELKQLLCERARAVLKLYGEH